MGRATPGLLARRGEFPATAALVGWGERIRDPLLGQAPFRDVALLGHAGSDAAARHREIAGDRCPQIC